MIIDKKYRKVGILEDKKVIDLLKYIANRDSINLDDVANEMEEMTRKDIIKNHPYSISYNEKQQRFYTYLYDETKPKNRKQVQRRNREDIENLIVEDYKKREKEKQLKKEITLNIIYPEWLNYKEAETSEANANKLDWAWNTYYKNEKIINVPLKDLTVADVKAWFLDRIAKHELTKKKYREMKSVINMMLDYAVEKDLIKDNVARKVRNISYKKFAKAEEKTVSEQVYIEDEQGKAIQKALEQYKKTKNTAYLAICMNFAMGLRVGELVALHTSDFTENHVTIKRQEIKKYIKVDGKLKRDGYEISDNTKTKKGERSIILTSMAKKFLNMILEDNKQRGYENGYLLISKHGDRMHEHSINNVLRKLNKKMETVQKGSHCIRKTCISNMVESNQLTQKEVMDFAGHKDYKTTEKYYVFSTKKTESRANAYENAICNNFKDVI